MQKWSSEIIKEKVNSQIKNKKIQIGIVGEQIYDHSVWNAITKGIVLNINKELFEINIFKLGKKNDDETALAKINSNTFIDVLNTLEEWCKTISSQNLDILIYPEIGIHPMTIQLASMRLAPIQIASWGHPETTGLPTIDYFISAELFEDGNSVNNYSEKLIKLAIKSFTFKIFNHLNSNNTWKKFNKVKRNKY
jgi:predicted O-linked N-acetylglucosamine transferase (SPINDLY family)